MAKEDQKPAVQITRKGVVIWIGLAFFVMGWMFVLGIMVGRGTAPVPLHTYVLEKELAALKAAMLQQRHDDLDVQARESDPRHAELGFYEELKKPPPKTEPRRAAPTPTATAVPAKTSAIGPAGQKSATSSSPTATPAKEPETAPSPPPTPKPLPAATPAPAPQPIPAPKPEPARAAVAPPVQERAAATNSQTPSAERSADRSEDRGRFTIQVAAFREIQSADEMVGTLRGKGYPAYQIRVAVPDQGEWFRVRVGAFENRQAAEAMLGKLNSDRVQGMVIGTN